MALVDSFLISWIGVLGPGPLLTRALATDTGIGHRRLCWNTSAHSRRGNQRPHEHVLRPDVGGLARHKHTNAADCMKRDCLACSLQLGWHHAAIASALTNICG